MLRKLLPLLIYTSISFNLSAQTKAFYLEAGGTGLLNSLNADFRFHDYGEGSTFKDGLGLRIGAGLSPKYIPGPYGHVVSTGGVKPTFLIGINTLGTWKYAIDDNMEFGANVLFTPANSIAEKWGSYKGKNRFIPSLNIGYRHQDFVTGSGVMWRFCYAPYFLDGRVHQWLGVSIGYSFMKK